MENTHWKTILVIFGWKMTKMIDQLFIFSSSFINLLISYVRFVFLLSVDIDIIILSEVQPFESMFLYF